LLKLGTISEINPKNLNGSKENLDDIEVSFIPMRNVEEETGKIDSSSKRYYKEVKKGYTPFANGDILFAKITPCMENGKIAIANNLYNGIGFGSTEFHIIRLKHKDLITKYFFYYLLQEKFRKQARRYMKGTAGQLRVPSSYLQEVLIPLPPINEQKRIVSKLEELLPKLDAGIEYLKKTQILLKQYRQSVLKYAFEGKLTEKWREENKEKLSSIERNEEISKKNGALIPIDKKFLYPLPSNWVWIRIGEICEGKFQDDTNRRILLEIFLGSRSKT
jgi:type I restriction enzyme, S subunit